MTVKKTPTKVPGIGQPPSSVDPATKKYLSSIVEAIEIRLGRRGDPRDRAVTLRELINSGLAEELKANKFDPNNITSSNLGMGVVPGPSGGNDVFGTPDTPVNFSATGGYQKVLLTWTAAIYLGHSQTEIWRHDSDVLGDAILVGITSGPTYVDNVGGDQSFYYWIRHISTTNEEGNYNATQGTLATTSPNVTVLLDELAGAITDSELSAVLSGRITDTETGIADLVTTYGSTTAAAASAAAALASQTAAAQDAVLTAADAQSTAQDALDTAADLAATAQDVIDTAASAGTAASEAAAALASANAATVDATQTALDVASTAADVISTAADAATTTSDVAQTSLDVTATAADVISTAADATQTALDAAATALDKAATNADVILTNADVVSTAADVIAAASSATAAATSSSASSSSALVAKARSIDAERALKASGSISERICMEPGNYVFAVEQDSTQIYKNGTLLTTLDRGVTEVQTLAQGDKLASSKPFNACISDNTTLASIAHAGRQFGMYITREQFHTVRIYPLSDGQAYVRSADAWDNGTMTGVTPVALTGGTMYSTTIDVGSDGVGYLSVRTTCDALVYKHYTSGYDHTVLNPASERIIIDVDRTETTRRMDENGTSSSATIVETGGLLSTSDLSEALWSGAIGDGDGSDCETHVPYEFLGDEYIVPNVTLSDFCVISPEDDLIVRVYDKDSTLLYTKTVSTAGDRGTEGTQDGTVDVNEPALSTDGPYYFSGNKPFYLRINLGADEDPVIGYRRDVKALAGNQAAVAATYYASEASASETAAGQEASAANTSAAAANTSAGAALASEQAAATSESNALGSANTATSQATLATTAKTDAETAETNAQASESAAASSASTASGHASTASTQATLATTAKTDAETAETNAETAETNAQASESAAASSESNAAGHASTASTQAGLATTAKTDAETAETNAQASETNASASESAAAASVITAAGHSSVASTQATLATDAASDSEDARDVVLIETAAAGEIRFVTKDAWIKNPQSYDLGTDDPRLIRNSSTYTSTSAEFITNDAEFGVAYMGALADNHAVGPRKVYPFASDKVYFVRVVARVVDDGTDNGGGRVFIGYNGFDASGTRQQTNPDYNNVQPFSVYKLVSDGVFEIAGFIGGPDYTDAQLEALNTVIDNAPSGQSGDRAYVTATGTDPVPTSIAFQLRQNSSSTIGQVALKSFEVIDVTELIKAEIQADAASGFAGSASVSAGAAAGSASTASGHASTASTQAGLATTARSGAETAETNAQASETAASNSEIASAGSAATAAGHASTASTKADLATSVGARANLIDQGASNAGFEQGVAGVGAPAGWTVEAQNSITNLGFVTDVGTTSEFGSELSYGIVSSLVYTTGHWVTHYKHFLVEPGKTLKTKCRVWNYDYENITPTTTNPQDSYWVGEDDTICVWSFYDSEGVFLSSSYSQSAGHLYAVANNITTSGALGAAINETWIDFEPGTVTVPANSVYAKIEIVGVDYNGIVVEASKRGDYTTWSGGNWIGRIDDVQFLCTDGSIQEISQGPIDAAVSKTAASVSQSAAAASVVTAAGHASTASTQAGLATTAKTDAETAETNAQASETAASNSESAAAASVVTAAGHASTASTQAGLATTAKTDAETAETNAQASESAAATSESNASGFASTASTQAGLATTAKTDAETAETNAQASESAAATSESNAAGHASSASSSSTLAATAKTDAESAQTAAESARDGIVLENLIVDSRLSESSLIGGWETSGPWERSSTQSKFGTHSFKTTSGAFSNQYPEFYYTDIPMITGEKFTWGAWVYKNFNTDITIQCRQFGGWATGTVTSTNAWQFVTVQATVASPVPSGALVEFDIRGHTGGTSREVFIDGLILVRGHHDLTVVEASDAASTASAKAAASAGAALTSSQSATASQTAAGNSASAALASEGLAATSASDASASEAAALVSETNAATSESNAAGSESSASSSSTLAASAQSAAEAALTVAKVEIASIGPSRVTPIVENWAYQSYGTNLQNDDDRFVATSTIAESHFTTSDSVFGDAYNFGSASTANAAFGPRKAYPYGSDKVYMVRVIYRVAVESTQSYASNATNVYLGATTRGGDGLTLYENHQPGQQETNNADGETEFVMVFHGEDYASATLSPLDIVQDNKTTQANNVIISQFSTTSMQSPNGSDTPAKYIGFHIRQNASSVSDGNIAVKSYEVFDITDVVLAELKADAAAVSAAAALVSESAASASETAAGQSASTASTQAGIATTKAGNASTSASQAATSESNASGHESAASTSETNAANSASDASDSEANALTYRNAAATSATNAASSESAAATSEGISAAIEDRMNLVDGGVVNVGFEADQASTSIDTWPTGWDCEGQRFDAPRDVGVVDNVVNSTGDFASTKSFGTHVENAGTTGHWLRLSKYFVAEATQKFNVDMAVRLAGTTTSSYNQDPEWIDEDDVFIIYNWYDEDGALLSQAAVSSATSEYNQANGSWVSGTSQAPQLTWFDYVSDEGTAPTNTAFVRIDLILIDDQPGNIGTDTLVNYATWAVGGNFRGYIDDVQFLSSNGSIVETNKANLEGAVSAAASQTSASNASASESAAGTSASTASSQAGIATTKAGEASTSASNAATSESNALGSANTAASQATLATTAKNDAETAETNAQASETAAASSETNAAGSASTASSQATLAATAKSDTDDLKDAVLVETAANGEIQFVNPTSWQQTQQSHNLYSGDFRFAGTGNATASFFIDNDAEFGNAYLPTLGLNESVSTRRVQPYNSDKVYLVRLIARVVNDGATIGTGVRVSLGINGWKADGTRITSSPDLNNYQPIYVVKTVADGTFELSVFFGGSDYTDAQLEAFDLVTENAPSGQSGGRAWAIIPPSSGTNNEPDLAFVNFQVRYNASGITDGQVALKTLEVIDVTESIKAEIEADASAISASAALVSQNAASASQTAAGNSASTATTQAGIASTKAGDASGFASDASGFATAAQTSASNASGSASTASTQAGLAATAKNDAESARDSMVLDNVVVDSRLANATLIGGWDTTLYERSSTQKYFGGHSLKSKSTIFSNNNPIFYRTDVEIVQGEKFTWGAWVYKNFSSNITLQFQQFGGWATGTVTSTNAWQFVTAQGTASAGLSSGYNLEMDIRSHTGGTSRELFIDGLVIVRGHHDLTVVETSDRAATAEVLSEVSAAASLSSANAASASATTAGDEATISTTQAGIATTKAGEALTYRNQAATSESNASGSASTASTQAGLAVTAKDDAEAARDGIVYQNYAFDGTFPGGVKPQWTNQSSAFTTSTTYKKIGTHSLKIPASSTASADIFESGLLDSFPDIAVGDKFTWGFWVYIDGTGTTNESFGLAGDGGWGTIATAVRNSWVFLTNTGTAGSYPVTNGLRLELRSAPIGSNTDNAIYIDGIIVVKGEVDLTSVEVDDSSVRSAHKSSDSAGAALISSQSATASQSAASTSASTASTQAGIATTKAGEASTFASNASTSESNASGFANAASASAGVASGHSSDASGFASAANTSAGAASTSATNAAASATAAAIDNRLLEARVNSPLNGHYANSEWYLYSITTAYVVSYFTGTDIRIQNMATGTWYDVKKNATALTNYRVDTLSGQSGIGPWRVSASGPIVCKHANGHMGVPANFGGTLLGNMANRYQPVDVYLFSPDSEASVDVFVSESFTGFSNTMTPNHTITVPAGGYYHWQQDVDWGSTQGSGNTSILFRSDARVCGVWVPNGGDYMVLVPLTNGEAVGGVETQNGSGYPYYNDGATNTTVTIESDGSARYYVNDDPKFYFMQAATADGAGGDAEFAIPREGLSDYYIWPEPNISNFRMVAVEPGTVKVMQADGTVLYTKEFGANTTTTSPTFLSEGSNTGNTDIHTGIGPYRFVGTVPFHLVCQEAGDDDETTMLGARQSKLAESGAIKAAAVALSTVSSSVDGQTASIAAQATSINGLEAQYTVKIDANGAVAGYGLASTTTSSGNNVSEFIVNADRFAILKDASDTGTAQVPFSVVTSSYTNNGVTVNPGVYITDAFIANGTINTAKIGNAAIDDAKIANLSAGKISTGTLNAANVNIAGVTSGIDLKSSASGARMEIKADSIKVFDSSGQVRIKLGNL